MRNKLYFPVYQSRGYPFSYLVGYHFYGKNGKKYTTVQWKKRHNLKGRKLRDNRRLKNLSKQYNPFSSW